MDNDLRPMNAETEEINVDFRQIDDIAAEYGIKQIDYLSVTVNGAEYEVLKGARALLDRSTAARVYAKGHARLADGRALHTLTEPFMRELGYQTLITRGETSSTLDKSWLTRAGDLFAWR